MSERSPKFTRFSVELSTACVSLFAVIACPLPNNVSEEPKYEALSAQQYRELFDRYYVAIRNYVYFKTSDSGLSEDIAQDAFVKLWENRAKIDQRTVKSFLYTIAGNLTINVLKRQQLHFKFQNQLSHSGDTRSGEYDLRMKEYEAQVNAVIASIPDGPREVFLMNRMEDLKYREIAERLGLSVKAVEKRMSKALAIIRDKLGVDL